MSFYPEGLSLPLNNRIECSSHLSRVPTAWHDLAFSIAFIHFSEVKKINGLQMSEPSFSFCLYLHSNMIISFRIFMIAGFSVVL